MDSEFSLSDHFIGDVPSAVRSFIPRWPDLLSCYDLALPIKEVLRKAENIASSQPKA